MGRSPCCEKVGLKKGPWTPEEDQKLLAYIEEHGHGSWRALPAKAGNVIHATICALGLQRCGKSCRLRWTNYLRPDIKRGKFSLQEEQTIIQLHALLGNRWSAIATHLPKRTDNEIKNYWNTHLKKRLTKMGIDPVTHKPKSDALGSPGQSKDAANLSHMAQWESARLEAEARLGRESKPLVSTNPLYQSHQLAGLTSSSVVQLLNKAAVTAPPPPPPLPPKIQPCLDVLKAWQGAWTKPITKDAVAAFSNSFFTSNGILESPTSTLNFSENLFTIPPVGFAGNSSSIAGVINYVENSGNDWKYIGNQNNFPEVSKVSASMETTMIHQLHEMPYPIDANYIADALRPLPSFVEGFNNHLLPQNNGDDNGGHCATDHHEASGQSDNNIDGICGGDDFEENKSNYWNNILNLVTLQSGSPVF